jgi:hypothetical protein
MSTPIYHDYARVYDHSGQLGFSLRMIAYLERLLGPPSGGARRVAGIGLRTGTVALAMAEAAGAFMGWMVRRRC